MQILSLNCLLMHTMSFAIIRCSVNGLTELIKMIWHISSFFLNGCYGNQNAHLKIKNTFFILHLLILHLVKILCNSEVGPFSALREPCSLCKPGVPVLKASFFCTNVPLCVFGSIDLRLNAKLY